MLKFIKHLIDPVRFQTRQEAHAEMLERLNGVLLFHGISLGPDGHFRPATAARTLSEAQDRVNRVAELTRRGVHADVLKFCRAELLDQNYFHAVLEATKSVADKIRTKSGLTCDGAEGSSTRRLASRPRVLALNTLRSQTEEDEQKGFANLLKGTFGTFRNPHAHAAKIHWPITEQDGWTSSPSSHTCTEGWISWLG